MNRRSSGFSVVGPEPEGPRYDGRQRSIERDPRTEPPRSQSPRTRRSTRNRGPSGVSVSTAVDGFLHAKAAEGLSPRTLHNYDRYLRTWIEWAGDPPIGSVTAQGIRSYLAWLRTEYKPHRFGGNTEPLSGKTIRNVYMFLSSFFGWASVEFKIEDPTDRVQPPRFQPKPIEPLTREEVQAMVHACELAHPAVTNGRKSFQMRRRTRLRDVAVLMTLLDTGLRVSEVCALRIGDVDLKTGQVEIRHGPRGGAKGGKGRVVFLGKETRHYVWRYLASRESKGDLEAPLFAGAWDRPMTQNSLRLLVKSLAAKAGVRNCYPHKFRHTFAITYLRSGGDVFTLQALLGHSTLDMVRHYSMISRVDVADAHRRASPVDNWRL